MAVLGCRSLVLVNNQVLRKIKIVVKSDIKNWVYISLSTYYNDIVLQMLHIVDVFGSLPPKQFHRYILEYMYIPKLMAR